MTVKLTEEEKKICKEYSKRGEDGLVNCRNCPLEINRYSCKCYATIDGRTKEAKQLRRYGKEETDV
jgi:hypothetical protein